MMVYGASIFSWAITYAKNPKEVGSFTVRGEVCRQTALWGKLGPEEGVIEYSEPGYTLYSACMRMIMIVYIGTYSSICKTMHILI